MVGSLVTIVVNVPINQEVATWNPAALPPGYEKSLRRWWEWHQVRMVVMLIGMSLVFAAMLGRSTGQPSRAPVADWRMDEDAE